MAHGFLMNVKAEYDILTRYIKFEIILHDCGKATYRYTERGVLEMHENADSE